MLENAHLGLAHRIRNVYAQNAANIELEETSLVAEPSLSPRDMLRLERLRNARRRADELSNEDVNETAAWIKARMIEVERRRAVEAY